MDIVSVTFGENGRVYMYNTSEDMRVGRRYHIVTSVGDTYGNAAVTVVDKVSNGSLRNLKTITKAVWADQNTKAPHPIKSVRLNRNRGETTVYWKDGTSTTVHTHGEDKKSFNPEVGVAMCFMKKAMGEHSMNEVFDRLTPPVRHETNGEHYAETIRQMGGIGCIAKVNGKPCRCAGTECSKCEFSVRTNGNNCTCNATNWASQPYTGK